MVVQFLACDKDSSDMFARSITTDSEEFLRNEWQSFKRDVPFMRWYSDNTLEEGTEEDEALVADLD